MDITLALGGGGVRGISHLGVIQFLEEKGFCIRAIAGTSAGSIFGAFVCAGHKPVEVADFLSKIDQKKLFSRSQNADPSLIGVAGIKKILADLLGNTEFKNLSIPFATTAVDLLSGREVILNKGKVIEAVLASAAIPGVFPPVQKGNLVLIDGGILDPVPVTVSRWLNSKPPVIASVLSQYPPTPLTKNPEFPIPIPGPAVVKEYFSHLKITHALNIFLRAVDIESVSLTELRLKVDHPSIIVRPDVSNIGILDKIDIFELMNIGYQAAERAFTDFDKPFNHLNRFFARLKRTDSTAESIQGYIHPEF